MTLDTTRRYLIASGEDLHRPPGDDDLPVGHVLPFCMDLSVAECHEVKKSELL